VNVSTFTESKKVKKCLTQIFTLFCLYFSGSFLYFLDIVEFDSRNKLIAELDIADLIVIFRT
jgi:hypothetical protein